MNNKIVYLREKGLFIKCLQAVFLSKDFSIDSFAGNQFDWNIFNDYCEYHDISPFVYRVLKDKDINISQEIMLKLKNNFYCSLTRNERIWAQYLEINNIFSQTPVKIVPLKGISFFYDLYANLPGRLMNDIDLFVKYDDLDKAIEIFKDLGYKQENHGYDKDYWLKNQYHITFKKDDDKKYVPVELHWGLDYKRKGKHILMESWNNLRSFDLNGKNTSFLSLEDSLLSLALHNRRLGRSLCLKSAYDAVLLFKKYEKDFDWQYFSDMCDKYNLHATVYFIFVQMKLVGCFKSYNDLPFFCKISSIQKKMINKFIERNSFLPREKRDNQKLYLKIHFLLYDNILEPIRYVLNVPKEQFTKFYGLQTYSKRTYWIYKFRVFYIIFRKVKDFFSRK